MQEKIINLSIFEIPKTFSKRRTDIRKLKKCQKVPKNAKNAKKTRIFGTSRPPEAPGANSWGPFFASKFGHFFAFSGIGKNRFTDALRSKNRKKPKIRGVPNWRIIKYCRGGAHFCPPRKPRKSGAPRTPPGNPGFGQDSGGSPEIPDFTENFVSTLTFVNVAVTKNIFFYKFIYFFIYKHNVVVVHMTT